MSENAILKMKENIAELSQSLQRNINIMEICGTHTQAIYRFGIKSALPASVKLISGPGCPVCVTAQEDIDYMLGLASLPDVEICCYGDMLRVPGSNSSLAECSALHGNIHIVTSALEAVELAVKMPQKTVIFWAVGFETTTPMTAAAVLRASEQHLPNFRIICMHKTMPAVMRKILAENNRIDALLCPGHVAVITGEQPFCELGLPAVISGFDEADILSSIELCLRLLLDGQNICVNNYRRYVRPQGNVAARQAAAKVFEPCDAKWRGLGVIEGSGLRLKEAYAGFDAARFFAVEPQKSIKSQGCLCGEIIKGNKTPEQCVNFAIRCNPQNPIGPCMVSSEGACAALYKYGRE